MLCMTMTDLVADELDRVHEWIAGRFTRAEPRARVRADGQPYFSPAVACQRWMKSTSEVHGDC
jgi:hypothetical protein